jgi:hypothetical protein
LGTVVVIPLHESVVVLPLVTLGTALFVQVELSMALIPE